MKTYTIPKGEHYSMHLPKPYLGLKKEFNLKVIFGESCRYDLSGVDQLDINKLWGVSFGNHEQNSIRIGWNYDQTTDLITLYSYIYNDGERFYEEIGSVKIDDICEIKFQMYSNSFSFEIAKEGWFSGDYNYPSIKLGYYLFPYFGGNKVAPHTINIKLDVK